jgi:hypothetical protein
MRGPPETESGGPTKTATEFLGFEEVLSLLVESFKGNIGEVAR